MRRALLTERKTSPSGIPTAHDLAAAAAAGPTCAGRGGAHHAPYAIPARQYVTFTRLALRCAPHATRFTTQSARRDDETRREREREREEPRASDPRASFPYPPTNGAASSHPATKGAAVPRVSSERRASPWEERPACAFPRRIGGGCSSGVGWDPRRRCGCVWGSGGEEGANAAAAAAAAEERTDRGEEDKDCEVAPHEQRGAPGPPRRKAQSVITKKGATGRKRGGEERSEAAPGRRFGRGVGEGGSALEDLGGVFAGVAGGDAGPGGVSAAESARGRRVALRNCPAFLVVTQRGNKKRREEPPVISSRARRAQGCAALTQRCRGAPILDADYFHAVHHPGGTSDDAGGRRARNDARGLLGRGRGACEGGRGVSGARGRLLV